MEEFEIIDETDAIELHEFDDVDAFCTEDMNPNDRSFVQCLANLCPLTIDGKRVLPDYSGKFVFSGPEVFARYKFDNVLVSNSSFASLVVRNTCLYVGDLYPMESGEVMKASQGAFLPKGSFAYCIRVAERSFVVYRTTNRWCMEESSFFFSEGCFVGEEIVSIGPCPRKVVVADKLLDCSQIKFALLSKMMLTGTDSPLIVDVDGVLNIIPNRRSFRLESFQGYMITSDGISVYESEYAPGFYIIEGRDVTCSEGTPMSYKEYMVEKKRVIVEDLVSLLEPIKGATGIHSQIPPDLNYSDVVNKVSFGYRPYFSADKVVRLSDYIVGSEFHYHIFLQRLTYSGLGGPWEYVRNFLIFHGIYQVGDKHFICKPYEYYKYVLYTATPYYSYQDVHKKVCFVSKDTPIASCNRAGTMSSVVSGAISPQVEYLVPALELAYSGQKLSKRQMVKVPGSVLLKLIDDRESYFRVVADVDSTVTYITQDVREVIRAVLSDASIPRVTNFAYLYARVGDKVAVKIRKKTLWSIIDQLFFKVGESLFKRTWLAECEPLKLRGKDCKKD